MAIRLEHVVKRFGDFTALNDVSLAIPAGSLTAILGPSGSGKSTLLRVIAGLEQPDSGVVRIFGDDATLVAVQKRGVGFVFQHYAAFKHMTVRENVAFGLAIRKKRKEEIRKRVDELLEIVQLQGFAHRYPSQLSGGQRQRMALARALAPEPRVLLLDEPFGAIDAQVRQELRSWLRRFQEQVGVTTILVTHDQEEAMEVAHSIVVMNRGRIEQIGAPEFLYDHPANEFVMTFIGQANRFGETFVRPHDVSISTTSDDAGIGAFVLDMINMGFEVRAELMLDNGEALMARLSRERAEKLGLRAGQQVWVNVNAGTTFAANTALA